ncbi:MAG: hypothetical protein K2X99_04405 [Gemmatimonadaceae bacterium]|nr:hypothetical protein [Gemmatimonadaceae bacterium]
MGEAVFSRSIPTSDADALCCEWEASDELFTFAGPAVWYTAEPRENPRYGVQMFERWRSAVARARPEQLLFPAQPDPHLRVPHVTHRLLNGRPRFTTYDGRRTARAVAVITNAGGAAADRWADVVLRNRFATAGGVHLYGPQWAWKDYHSIFGRISWRPQSYRGELADAYRACGLGDPSPGAITSLNTTKYEVCARYHAAICLENFVEPFYFSEKFVDAVLSDCVPIYHAHPTVRDGVLRGASWIDPADHGMSVRRTIAAALAADRIEIAARNRAWLVSPAARETEWTSVWARIAEVLRKQHGVRSPG